jgi:tetratricopeptide (TPR) repeat protein
MKSIAIILLLSISGTVFCQPDKKIIDLKNYFDNNDYKTCLVLVNNHLTENPRNTHFLYYKALCEFHSNNFDTAVHYSTLGIERLTAKDTLEKDFRYLRAYSYSELNDLNSAIKESESLIKLFPEKADYYLFKAHFESFIPDFKSAIATLNKCLNSTTELRHLLYNNLSYYSIEAGEYNNAIDYADKGLKHTSDSTWTGTPLNNKGFATGLYINIEEGLKLIDQSLVFKPENSYAYFYKGILNLHLKNIDIACENFLKSKKLGAVIMTRQLIEDNCK